MFKTILVPIDLGETGATGSSLGLARNLAQKSDGKIVLLHVMAPVPGFAALHLPAGAHEQAKSEALATLKEIAASQGVDGTAETIVREGPPYPEIIDMASEIGADLIIIASHDPGVGDFLLGSVAARVVRHAHCSVFVTRKLDG